MRKGHFPAVVVALGIWGLASAALAQQEALWPESQQPTRQDKPFLDRLSDFFSGQPSSKQANKSTQPAPQTPGAGQDWQSLPAPPQPVGGAAPPTSRIAGTGLPEEPPMDGLPNSAGGPSNTASNLPPAGANWPRSTMAGPAAANNAPTAAPAVLAAPPAAANAAASSSEPSLHERMEGFRQSVFDGSSSKALTAFRIDDFPFDIGQEPSTDATRSFTGSSRLVIVMTGEDSV